MLSARGTSLLTIFLLGLVTAAGAVLRLQEVAHSLWLDELHTAWCVSGDLADVAPRARIGNYSPVYFYLVWASTHLVGLNEWGLRLPSLLAGIALIPVIHFATARFAGSRAAGLTAAAIVAFDGAFFGWYSQEARPFALVQLLAVVHVWVFFELVNVERRPRTRHMLRAVLIAATVTLFYLHYTTPLLLCGELAWYAACRLLPQKPELRRPVHYAAPLLAIDLGVATAACLPAASHLAEIFERRANWRQFVPQPTWDGLVTLFDLAPWALAVSIVPWAAAHLLRLVFRRPWQIASPFLDLPRQPPSALLAYCWYLAPLAVAALLTWLGLAHVCYGRYLMVCSVALPVAAAWGVAVSRRRHLGLAAGVGLLTVVLLQMRPGNFGEDTTAPDERGIPRHLFVEHFTEDWRGAVEFVRQHDPNGRQPVFVWAGLIEEGQLDEGQDPAAWREYLLFPISGPYTLDDGRACLPLTPRGDHWLTASHIRQAQTSGGGWFIFRSPEASYPDHPKPVERLARDLTEEFAEGGVGSRVTRRESFRGLAVIHVAVR